MNKAIWISWHKSRRTITLSKWLDVELFAVQIEGAILLRHCLSLFWTLLVLIKKNPKIVIIQYSYLLLVILSLYKSVFKTNMTIICDCHTKALRRTVSGRFSSIFSYLKCFSFKRVDVCIISNEGQESDARKYCKNVKILPDAIPQISRPMAIKKIESYIVFVCSFDVDEPVEEMLLAADRLAKTVDVYVTGSAPNEIEKKYANNSKAIFTGFLEGGHYDSLIAGASCVVACTTEEGCLQSAGYEALSAEVPFVTSDTLALRSYFLEHAVYVNNSREEIVSAVLSVLTDGGLNRLRLHEFKEIKEVEFFSLLERLKLEVGI